MIKIFISHAIKDKELALQLKGLVEEVSLGLTSAWLSSSISGLKIGSKLLSEIHKKLSESDLIIILLTANSLDRPWLLYELGYVANINKSNIIPLIFDVDIKDLIAPLSIYKVFHGHNIEDLTKMLVQIVLLIAPKPNLDLINRLAINFVKYSSEYIKLNSKLIEDSIPQCEYQLINKFEASEIFHKKIADKSITDVTILSYTNQVESGTIDKYRVIGKKNITIFKRSIISELKEEQICNIHSIKNNEEFADWDKYDKLLSSTYQVENEFKYSKDVNVTHYFYSTLPVKRAFIFNNEEALLSYYHLKDDFLKCHGSIYEGMGDSNYLWIKKGNPLSNYLIEQLISFVKILKQSSRSFKEELNLINNPIMLQTIKEIPFLEVKAILFDLDGVLLDSMKNYEIAWIKALKKIDVDISSQDPYIYEGYSSEITIKELCKKYKRKKKLTSDEIILCKKIRDEILEKLEAPSFFKLVKEILEEFSLLGLEIFIVTSSTNNSIRELIDKKLKLTFSYGLITGKDVKNRKPNPEPFITACNLLNVLPQEAIVIENSPGGILSAVRAGCLCFGLNTGPLDDSLLAEQGAIEVFKTHTEILDKIPKIMNLLGNLKNNNDLSHYFAEKLTN